jgi:hypothetical protein
MKKEELTFEDWIRYVFDHPVTDPAWHFDTDSEYWDLADETVVCLLTETFERSGTVLLLYSDAQVNQGLWFLIGGGCSDYAHALKNTSVDLANRLRCILSFFTVFEQCFANRCSPHLSHLDEAGANPLNAVCYMWWDILPHHGIPSDPEFAIIDAAMIDVMERTLDLDHDACRESALHGLGHWRSSYPKVSEIIARFLERTPTLREELQEYAEQAKKGYVL